MTRRALPLLLVLAAAVLALAACGGGGGSTSASTTPPAATGGGSTGGGGGGGSTVKITADPSGALKYTESQVEAKAGSVTIDFTNMASVPHNVTIEGNGASGGTDTVTGTSTSTTIDLQPGTYTFFCSVDSHRQAGMEGKLVVK
jgi:plastocyanin